MVVDVPDAYMTLLRIRAMYPHKFYKQDWYDRHAFAHIPIPGKEVHHPRSAAQIAWWYIKSGSRALDRKFIWTPDVDDKGDRVYVGWADGGLQIHRHLTIREEDFIDLLT